MKQHYSIVIVVAVVIKERYKKTFSFFAFFLFSALWPFKSKRISEKSDVVVVIIIIIKVFEVIQQNEKVNR